MRSWTLYRLGDFMKRQYNSIEINDFLKYKRITIKTKGQGIKMRDEIEGIEIGTKNQFQVRSNQFLLSKIDAMNGAFGMVPEECNGGIITGNFWTYELNNEIIERDYLQLLCFQQVFTQFSFAASEGTTNRKYLREDKFLNLSIPLPPLPEQQRIVAKIESIKNRIEKIQRLRAEQEKEIYFLRNSIFIDLQNEFENVPIGKFIVRHEDLVELDPDGDYKQVTVKMEHKGVLLRGMMKGSEIGSKQYLANAGDFIISKIDARNGAMGFIPDDLEGAIVTGDFPLYNFSKEINPKFFYYFSNTLYFDNECKNASEGTTNRKRLKLGRFENILIPCPPRKEQNIIVSLLDKLNDLTTTHNETEKELSQLMPALLDKAFKGEL